MLKIFAVGDVGKTSPFAERRDRMVSRCPNRCTCNWKFTLVNCSKRGLTDVPSNVPYQAQFLLLNGNHITTLGEPAIYQNLSRLQVLDLSHNRIKALEDAIFRYLSHLEVLDLSHNLVNAIERDAFVGLFRLKCLNLSFNHLPHLHHGFFSPLVLLTELVLTNARASFVPGAFLNLTNLRRLDFRHNRLLEFPKFLYDNTILFPKLVVLHLDGNNIETMRSFGLDSLEYLGMGSNRINMMHGYTLRRFKSLKTLNLYNNILRHTDIRAFCSTTLKKLDLSLSRFILSSKMREVFNCIPNLEELLLINVHLDSLSHPFRNLTKLKKLNMQGMGLSDVALIKMLPDLRQLEWLSLTDNAIHKLRRGVFENFAGSLKVLSLSSNRITTLNITSLPEQLWKTLERIDLSDNPFTCDCHLAWFRGWVSTTNVTVSNWNSDPKQYQCSAPASLRKKSLKYLKHPTEEECFEAPMDWCLLSVVLMSIAASASSTIGSVLYRFRWYAKYWYFKYKVHCTYSNVYRVFTVSCQFSRPLS